MNRCICIMFLVMLCGISAKAQLINNGATITVQSGATLKCSGNIVNTGTIHNAGLISSDGELRNEVGGVLANDAVGSVYEATTKFVNYGSAFKNINLRLIGSSNTDSIKSGIGSTYLNVTLAKGAGTTATLSDAMLIKGGFSFNNDNNKLVLEDETLTMDSVATFQNADNNQFVITNSTGAITRTSLGSTAFVYPIGFSATEFNPLTISNSGTVDNISARCMQNVLANGNTGAVVSTNFVNSSWVVTEGTPGGSNLNLTAEWASTDEPISPAFNRQKSGIARFNTGTDWDLPASNVIAATGSGPYNRSRTGITSTGIFAVADLGQVNAARLALKVMLQGAYAGSGLMSDALRSQNLVPTTQPYSSSMSSRFARVGVYDGSTSVNESVPSVSVFDVATANDDIVDWVYISLQDGADPTSKLQTKAALIQRDGDIVEYNASSGTYGPVRMPIDADGNYYLIVGHRNHLSVRLPVASLLQDNTTFTYNFSDAQNKAYQNPGVTANAAMKDLGSGFFGLWAGNANANGNVRYAGSQNDPGVILTFLGTTGAIVSGVYSNLDLNMNGNVRYAGSQNDPGFLLSNVVGSTGTVIIEH